MLTAGLTATLLVLVFSKVPLAAVGDALSRTNLGLILGTAVVALWLNTAQSAAAFRNAVVAAGASLSWPSALRATLANLTLHNLLPAGSGNLGRVAVVHRRDGIPLPTALLATSFLLWLKFACLLLLAFAGSLLTPLASSVTQLSLGATTATWIGLGAMAHFLIPRLARHMPWSGLQRLATALTRRPLLTRRPALVATAHSFILVAGEVVIFLLALRALGHDIPWGVVLTRTPIILLAAKLPLTVLGLGTREAAALLLLSDFVPAQDIVGATLLLLTLTQLLPATLGAGFTRWFVGDIATK